MIFSDSCLNSVKSRLCCLLTLIKTQVSFSFGSCIFLSNHEMCNGYSLKAQTFLLVHTLIVPPIPPFPTLLKILICRAQPTAYLVVSILFVSIVHLVPIFCFFTRLKFLLSLLTPWGLLPWGSLEYLVFLKVFYGFLGFSSSLGFLSVFRLF